MAIPSFTPQVTEQMRQNMWQSQGRDQFGNMPQPQQPAQNPYWPSPAANQSNPANQYNDYHTRYAGNQFMNMLEPYLGSLTPYARMGMSGLTGLVGGGLGTMLGGPAGGYAGATAGSALGESMFGTGEPYSDAAKGGLFGFLGHGASNLAGSLWNNGARATGNSIGNSLRGWADYFAPQAQAFEHVGSQVPGVDILPQYAELFPNRYNPLAQPSQTGFQNYGGAQLSNMTGGGL